MRFIIDEIPTTLLHYMKIVADRTASQFNARLISCNISINDGHLWLNVSVSTTVDEVEFRRIVGGIWLDIDTYDNIWLNTRVPCNTCWFNLTYCYDYDGGHEHAYIGWLRKYTNEYENALMISILHYNNNIISVIHGLMNNSTKDLLMMRLSQLIHRTITKITGCDLHNRNMIPKHIVVNEEFLTIIYKHILTQIKKKII